MGGRLKWYPLSLGVQGQVGQHGNYLKRVQTIKREGGNKERRERKKRSSFNPGQLETKIKFPNVKLCPRIHNAESNGNGRAKNVWQ